MRFKIVIAAVVEAPSAAVAAADAARIQKLLDQPAMLRLVLPGVQVIEAKVDPRITPA